MDFSAEQMDEAKKALAIKMDLEYLLEYLKPETSIEEMKEIRKKTIEKEKADANHLSKIKLLLAIFVLFVLLSVWLFYSLIR